MTTLLLSLLKNETTTWFEETNFKRQGFVLFFDDQMNNAEDKSSWI